MEAVERKVCRQPQVEWLLVWWRWPPHRAWSCWQLPMPAIISTEDTHGSEVGDHPWRVQEIIEGARVLHFLWGGVGPVCWPMSPIQHWWPATALMTNLAVHCYWTFTFGGQISDMIDMIPWSWWDKWFVMVSWWPEKLFMGLVAW